MILLKKQKRMANKPNGERLNSPMEKERGNMFKKDFLVSDKELKEAREKISCPELNDDHYGVWGSMSIEQRIIMYRMINTIKELDKIIQEERKETNK